MLTEVFGILREIWENDIKMYKEVKIQKSQDSIKWWDFVDKVINYWFP